MNRTLINFGFLHIQWYSFFVFLAMLTAIVVIKLESKKKKVDDDYLIDLIFYGIIFGILGARVYYVLFNLDYYLSNPKEIFMIWNGGLAIHGGIISALTFIYFYTKKKNKNLLLTLDIMSVGVIIAQAIGRWGNFFNQEAYGRIVTKAFLQNMHLPKFIIEGMYISGSYREPTFLYESIASLMGFIVLIILRKNKKIKTGQLVGTYLVWYGVERAIIESFRSDSLMLGPLKIAQIVSIVSIIVGIYLIIKNIKSNKYYQTDCIDVTRRKVCTKK